MRVPLDKLIGYGENKYVFTKAAIEAVDRIGNMNCYPDHDLSWKVVPNIMHLMLNDDIHFTYTPNDHDVSK